MDIVFQGDNGNLSYTLFLSPKAEINPFKFKIEGADKIAINKDGDLEIKTSFGTFLEKQPSAYQEKDGIKITVSSKLVILKKNQVGFKIGKYNKSLPLVIE